MHSTAPTDIHHVERVIERTNPDEIYNLGGPSSVALSFRQPRETFKSITLASLNILQAIRADDASIRYYGAASSECFGDTGDTPANEQTPFSPLSPYAEAKAEAFRRTAEYRDDFGLFASSGILFNHESPLRPEGFVTRKIISGAARIAADGSGTLRLGNLNIQRDWGWAPEYVDAMWRMLQKDQPGDYVIATENSRSLKDFADAAFTHFGLDWRDHVESDPALFRPTDIAISAGDASKAHELLGWSAQTHLEGVVRLMAEALTEKDNPGHSSEGVAGPH
jgi:GDPmannose 4,6-dehydratase